MAIGDHTSLQRDGAAAEMHAVAADMTAIFGAASTFTGDRAAPLRATMRARTRRPITAIAAVLIAAAVAAGLLAGRTVPTAPSTPAARPHAAARPQPAPSSGQRFDSYALDVFPPAATADVQPPVAASLPVREATASRPPVTAEPPVFRPEATVIQAPQQTEPAAEAPAAVTRGGCDGAGCWTEQVEAADDRLGEAFDEAEQAGVRGRTLRQYQREWDRARRRSLDRPDDALRLYAMITSDIRMLTENATRDAAVER